MTTLYTLNMEGDFGQNGYVFESESDAKACAEELYAAQRYEGDGVEPFEEFWDELCSTSEVFLWTQEDEFSSYDRLSALENAGVDNWSGYDYAMDILHGRDD